MPANIVEAADAAERNIVEKIDAYLNTYMVFPDPVQSKIVALWVLHTWTFSDSFPIAPMTTPYLYINSSEPQSGKTTLIDLLEPIALNSERTIDMTSSVLFHLIEDVKPTMFIDEVDTIWAGAKNEPLRAVLNGGYKHSGYVWRQQGRDTVKFRTFSPKLLAGIDNGHMPETVATRSIEIELKKVAKLDPETGEVIAPDGTKREIYYSFLAEETADQLVREIQAFIAEWAAKFHRYMPKPIPGLAPRQFEIAFPLLQVAHAVGIEAEARDWIKAIFAPKPKRDTAQQALIRRIHTLFNALGVDKLHTSTIVDYLNETDEGGWNGKLLTNRLKGAVEGTTTTMHIGNRDGKGYYRHQFTAAFEGLS